MNRVREVVYKSLAFVGLGIVQLTIFGATPSYPWGVVACAASEETLRVLPFSGSWRLRRWVALVVGLAWGTIEGLGNGSWFVFVINSTCHAGYGLIYCLLYDVHPMLGFVIAVGLHATFNLCPAAKIWIHVAMAVLLVVSWKKRKGAASAAPLGSS